MEEFRQQYKYKHPNDKSVAAVDNAEGDKWKSMSDAEKAPYKAKAEKRKEEYNKKMLAYNKKSSEPAKSAERDESDKSKSEVNNEVDNEDGNEEEDEDDRVELNGQRPVILYRIACSYDDLLAFHVRLF